MLILIFLKMQSDNLSLETIPIDNEVWVSVHSTKETLYTTRVSSDELSDEDLRLLCDSLEFVLNKYNDAINYIKSKQNNL